MQHSLPKSKVIRVSNVFVPTDGDYAGQAAILKDDAETSEGGFITTNPDGTGTADAIKGIIERCGAPPPSVAAIAIGATIAAVGGGGAVLLYKTFHHGKPHVIRLAMRCGLGGFELEEIQEKELKNIPHIHDIKQVQEKFGTALDVILKSRKKLQNVIEVKEFVGWCRQAKQDPKQDYLKNI